MIDQLKSPSCHDCARDREMYIPSTAHILWQGTCANCGCDGFVSAAADWREVSPAQSTDDLIQKLLSWPWGPAEGLAASKLMSAAATEIESLRTALQKIAYMGLGTFGNRPADVARRALGLDNG